MLILRPPRTYRRISGQRHGCAKSHSFSTSLPLRETPCSGEEMQFQNGFLRWFVFLALAATLYPCRFAGPISSANGRRAKDDR